MIARSRRMLAILTIFGAGIVNCGALANPSAGEAPVASTADGSAQRIETLIRSWFAQLEDPAIDPNALVDLLADPNFELLSADQTLRDPRELRAWVLLLRTTDPHVAYEIDSIHIESVRQDLYRARFEFDRRTMDDAGLAHVSRREHTWTVRAISNATPILLEIQERPLLPYPGTGPEIVCY